MFLQVLLVLCAVYSSRGDTPANCSYEDIRGTWLISLGKAGGTNKIDCNDVVEPISEMVIHLLFPDVVVDKDGNKGFWTLIYNQGFAFVLNGRKYFAFSAWRKEGSAVVSLCDRTFNGWVHDEVKNNQFPPQNWGCYYAKRLDNEEIKPKKHLLNNRNPFWMNKRYQHNEDFINQINKVQSSWRATHYKEYDGMKLGDLMRRSGGRKVMNMPKVKPSIPTRDVLEAAAKLPDSFDWRNVNGTNYISPIRNQGTCGSCYAFASMAMLEARVRILTHNKQQPIFSTQNIVSCSNYSQGCEGGFPYLIGGKYSEDFGNIPEECYPYLGQDSKCEPVLPKCSRSFATNYYYIGGFYGGCNEPLMQLELVKNGPFAIAFEVYHDFMHYKGGVYHHTGLTDRFNPLEVVNHGVLVVGYGIDTHSGEKYWVMKNSWSEKWGEQGFFRILRGVDECSCESVAVSSLPRP